MRSGLTILLSCAPLPFLLTFAVGCGGAANQSAPPQTDSKGAATPQAAATAAGVLRVQVNQTEGAEATSVDILGLTDGERRAFSQLTAAERAAALSVHVDGAADLPAVGGESTVAGESLRFTPRFPLARGMKYRVTIERGLLSGGPAKLAGEISLDFATAAAVATPATEVTRIFPTRDELPENQLKFYIHFSGPMNRGDAYRHIHLLDADGQELEAVFLELGEELWEPGLRRFTLLCDPGRVKRGLVPREELGSVLTAGKDYTLVIDADWRDAHGKPLAQTARKKFHVGPPDHLPIDTAAWKIEAPRPSSRDPLVVRFPEPLEHSLLERMLRVQDKADAEIAGRIETAEGETTWRFTPNEPWPAGDYQLLADAALEDLAGNAIGRAFDADTSEAAPKSIEGSTVAIPFTIR